MTDTAALADVVLPATTQLEHLDVVFSWGHHYLTWNEPAIEPLGRGQAEHRDLPAARRAPRPRRSAASRSPTPSSSTRCWPASRRTACASAAGRRSTSARGRFRTPRAASAPRPAASTLHAEYVPPAEVADAALAERFPLAMITPKTHLFLNSTFANQERQHSAQPRPEVVLHPGRRRPRAASRTAASVRVFNDRGAFACAARVSDDARPGVLVAPMGWWNADYAGRPQRPGDDLAAADRARQRADLQRQPRRGRSGWAASARLGRVARICSTGSSRSPP